MAMPPAAQAAVEDMMDALIEMHQNIEDLSSTVKADINETKQAVRDARQELKDEIEYLGRPCW